jgi:hypothetical protein
MDAKISLFVKFFFVFFCTTYKNISFHETVHAHIEYENMYGNIFFYFLTFSNLIFR